jgi:hypothetical protein
MKVKGKYERRMGICHKDSRALKPRNEEERPLFHSYRNMR